MKRHNLIFLLFFILLTFAPIPVFRIFREQIGYKNTENKAESDFPELNSQNFSTWPRRFEEYLSDTLPFKTQFIELFRGFQLHSGLDFTQSDVIRGKNDILFYRKTVENYKGLTRFTDEELVKIKDNLNAFFEIMESRGARCMLFIAPDKEQVYPDLMPDRILRVSTDSRGDQLTAYLEAENVSFPVLYPKQMFQDRSESIPIYYITDTHWNDLGGWAAAESIKSAFTGNPETATAPPYHRYDNEGKDLAGMLGLSEFMPEGNAIEIDYTDGLEIYKTQTINYGHVQRYASNSTNSQSQKKLMVIGDSFSEYYVRAALHDIKDVLFVTYGDLSLIDLEAETPDYLVVMLVERNLPFLLNYFY